MPFEKLHFFARNSVKYNIDQKTLRFIDLIILVKILYTRPFGNVSGHENVKVLFKKMLYKNEKIT
jgi:hypothetical protein